MYMMAHLSYLSPLVYNMRYVSSGATTIDMADHYGSAELIVGEYIKQQGGGSHDNIQVCTKWVPKPGRYRQ